MRNVMVTKVGVLALAGALSFAASATRVWSNQYPNDSRCVLTGCTYGNAISNQVSFGIWVKDVDYTNCGDLVSLGGTCHVNLNTSTRRGFAIIIHNRSTLGYNLSGDTVNGTRVAKLHSVLTDLSWCTDGRWHFLMLTVDCVADEAKLYLDGECLCTDKTGITTFAPERCLQFGGGICANTSDTSSPTRDNYGASAANRFAEVSLYDRALTGTEVAALAKKRADPFDAHLIGYWPGTDNSNWALHAVRRTDGSFVQAVPYYPLTPDDPDILPFAYPSGRFVISPARATQENYTAPTGTVFNSLGCPATNLVEAFAATPQSTTLYLLSGTHYPGMCLTNRNSAVTLASCNPATGAPDREGTVIDGSLIRNADSMYRDRNSSYAPVLRDLTFANGPRAATYTSSGAFTILNCTFTNLISSSHGGAVYSWTRKGAVISNCLFQACTAQGGGGAIYTIQNSDMSMSDYLTIARCRFEDCQATGSVQQCGGAIESARHNEINDCVFENCRAVSTGDNAKGGAVYAGGCSAIRRCVFRNCYMMGKTMGYGMALELTGSNTLENCTLTSPEFTDTLYGAYGWVHMGGHGAQTIAGLVATNLPASSPLFFPEASERPVIIRQCLLGVESRGCGPSCFIKVHQTSRVKIENCTSDASATFDYSGSWGGAAFENCILGGTFSNSSNASAYLTNCLVTATSGWKGGSNVWSRAKLGFVKAASGDYTLKRNAFARDRGNRLTWMGLTSLDLAGLPRLVNCAGLAYAADALPDLGAYEIQTSVPGVVCIIR